MAMKALRCPQCGAELELDDSKEFGFCSSCGTKIMLNERVEVKHSGDVHMQMDNSRQGRNRIAIGNRAFESGNYEEAYHYFTQGLEDAPEDVGALYRKGICAVRLSPLDNMRISELVSGRNAAREVIGAQAKAAVGDEAARARLNAVKAQYDRDLEELGNSMLTATSNYYYRCAKIDVAEVQAAKWAETVKLLLILTNSIYGEDCAERLLTKSIARCEEWLGYDRGGKISYFFKTTVNMSGKRKDQYNIYRMPDARRQAMEAARKEMADHFNNLPSRLERAKGLAEHVDALQGESGKLKEAMEQARRRYEEAKKGFWSANPELAAQRNKKLGLTWISVAVGAVIFAVTAVLAYCSGAAPYAAVGVLVFIAAFFLRNLIAKKTLAGMEKRLFPAEVKELEKALAAATEEWAERDAAHKNAQKELAAFEATKK